MLLFVAFNIGYIWIVKDRQFEERAAPTTRLPAELNARAPARVLILNFPYNPWVAKLTTRLVQGWSPEMILVNQSPDTCTDCVRLIWDQKTGTYRK